MKLLLITFTSLFYIGFLFSQNTYFSFFSGTNWPNGTTSATDLRSDSDRQQFSSYAGCVYADVVMSGSNWRSGGYPRYDTGNATLGFGMQLSVDWTDCTSSNTMTITFKNASGGSVTAYPASFSLMGVDSHGCGASSVNRFIDKVTVQGYAADLTTPISPTITKSCDDANLTGNTLTGTASCGAGNTVKAADVSFSSVARIVITYESSTGHPPTLSCGTAPAALISTDNPRQQEIYVSAIAVEACAACSSPSITTHPNTSGNSRCVGGTFPASLSVTATGDPTLTYQWYSNSTQTNTGGTLISGATSSTYLPQTATIGNFYYYCVVTNSCGSATSNASANRQVVADPVLSDPGSESICLGVEVSFTSNLSGAGVGTLNSPVWEYSSNGSTGWATVTNGTPTNATFNNTETASVDVSGNIASGTYYLRRYLADNVQGCGAISNNATLTINQPATTISATAIPDEAYLWGGTTNGNWSEVTNWYRRTGAGYAVASTAPETTRDVYIFPTADDACITATRALVNANPVNARDVYIGNSAYLGITGTMSLDVYGDFTNNGSLANGTSTNALDGNRTIRFRGAADQTIDAGGITNAPGSRKWLRNIEINKTGGDLLLGSDVQYSGTLTMTARNLNLNGRKLIMTPDASIVNETNDRRIYGTSGTVETTRTFGSALTNETFGNMGISVTTAVAPGATTIKRGHTQQFGLGNGSIYRYFDILPTTNTGLNATLSMDYFDNEIPGTHTEANFKFYRSTDAGSSWLTQFASSVNEESNFVNMSAIDAFSMWTISDDINQPLPVEFLGMHVTCQRGNEVIINWSTASESNAYYFAVERSRDGVEWELVGEVDATGNTSYETNYSFTDESVGPNFEGYYRLRQVDIDGKFELFAPMSLFCNEDKTGRVEIYPNPSDGNVNVFIYAEKGMEGPAVLEMTDAIGKLVQRQDITIQPGAAMYPINFVDKQSGMYYLNISS